MFMGIVQRFQYDFIRRITNLDFIILKERYDLIRDVFPGPTESFTIHDARSFHLAGPGGGAGAQQAKRPMGQACAAARLVLGYIAAIKCGPCPNSKLPALADAVAAQLVAPSWHEIAA